MLKTPLHRILPYATIPAALIAIGYSAFGLSFVERLPLLVLGILAIVASLVRQPDRAGVIRIEAVATFPAALLFHSFELAVLVAAFAAAGGILYDRIVNPRWSIQAVVDEANNVVATAIAALLYVSIVRDGGDAVSRIAGFLILLIVYFATHVVLRILESAAIPSDLATLHAFWGRQAKAMMLISPVIAAETLMYSAYGGTGAIIAFLPVLLVGPLLQLEAEHQQQSESIDRIERQLMILARSSQILFSSEGEEATVASYVDLLSEATPFRAAAVVTWETLPETTTEVFRFGACSLSDQAILTLSREQHLDDAPPPKAVIHEAAFRPFALAPDSRFQLSIGIQTAEVIYGVLIWETDDPAIRTEAVDELVYMLSAQCALSLQDQLLRREMHAKTVQLQRSVDTTHTAVEVARELFGEIELEPALTRIASTIRETLGFDTVLISLFDEKRDAFLPTAHSGLADQWEALKLRRQMSRVEADAFLLPEFRVSNSYRLPHHALLSSGFDIVLRSEQSDGEWSARDPLLVPLQVEDKLVGLLTVGEASDGKSPTFEMITYLELFASHAAGAIRSAHHIGEIRRLTNVDVLTPAYNHRYFQEALQREVTRHERSRRSFALLMLDIDDFKKINDSFGHPVGDEILRGLVDEVLRNVREVDVVARYGGEEFAIILPEAGQEHAIEVSERLRKQVSERIFSTGNVRNLQIQVTIGVAIYPTDGFNGTELVLKADAALYDGKTEGKNRVVLASESNVEIPPRDWLKGM